MKLTLGFMMALLIISSLSYSHSSSSEQQLLDGRQDVNNQQQQHPSSFMGTIVRFSQSLIQRFRGKMSKDQQDLTSSTTTSTTTLKSISTAASTAAPVVECSTEFSVTDQQKLPCTVNSELFNYITNIYTDISDF
jgi:hypothetical protein